MVFEKLQEILSGQFDVEASDITMESTIVEDLGADSLDLVDLIMAIEEEFDIEVPDELAENAKTVGDVVAYVEENI